VHLWSNGASPIVGSRDIQQWGKPTMGLAPLPQEQKRQFEINLKRELANNPE